MRENKRFKVGSLYYQCAVVPDLNQNWVPWIETWVYMGYVHKPGGASSSCDRPGYYYYFKKFDPTMANEPPDKWSTTSIYVPSLKQAMMCKLTWKQILSYGLPQMLMQLAENEQANTRRDDP